MSCPWAFVWITPLFLLGVLSILGLGALLLLIFGGIVERLVLAQDVDSSADKSERA